MKDKSTFRTHSKHQDVVVRLKASKPKALTDVWGTERESRSWADASRVCSVSAPVSSRRLLLAFPTFEVGPDSGVVARNFAHEFVQELGGGHRRGGLPRRRLLGRCQAGRQEGQFSEEEDGGMGERERERETCRERNPNVYSNTATDLHHGGVEGLKVMS